MIAVAVRWSVRKAESHRKPREALLLVVTLGNATVWNSHRVGAGLFTSIFPEVVANVGSWLLLLSLRPCLA